MNVTKDNWFEDRETAEERFFIAAYNYADIMVRDHRNARDPAAVQKRIDEARGKFYDTFKAFQHYEGEES